MKFAIRRTLFLAVFGAAALGASGLAQAQGYRYSWAPYASPHFYVGGSIGGANYADGSDAMAGWLANVYAPSANLASGDYLTTDAHQESGAFGAKIYGGAWVTPYLGLEVGYVSLGSVHWQVASYNTTGSFATSDYGSIRPGLWYESLLLGVDNDGFKAYGKAGAYQASVDISDHAFDTVGGNYFTYSDTLHNTGAVLGLGLQTPYGYRGALRLELEDFLNVGQSSSNTVPPWRGNILLLSAGYTFLF